MLVGRTMQSTLYGVGALDLFVTASVAAARSEHRSHAGAAYGVSELPHSSQNKACIGHRPSWV